jgi:segregation and condensation protein B
MMEERMEERKEETKQESRNEQLLRHKIECMLFVAGDPVAITELARVLDLPMPKTRNLLSEMEYSYRVEGRGVQLLVTHDTAQLVSNRDYIEEVKQLVNPDETKSVSQSLLETLAVIAYRQPVTRADVERVRGVRCDYAVTQLQKLDLIVEVGRKDVIGHPTLFGTTDKFLRQFGIHTVDEMPNFQHYSQEIIEDSSEEIPVV